MGSIVKEGKVWRAYFYRRGVRRSKRFPLKTHAVDWLHSLEAEPDLPPSQKPFRELALDFMEDRPDKEKEAIRIRRILRTQAWADLPVGQVTTECLAQWRRERLQQVKPGSVLREIGVLRAVFELARRELKLIQVNPVKDLIKPPAPQPRKRLITRDEIERVVEQLGYTGTRVETMQQEVAAAFLLACETAMRAGEILALLREDVFLDERYVQLQRSKTGPGRDVPLSPDALQIVEVMLSAKRSTTHLFSVSGASRDALFRKARRKAGLEGFTFHDARAYALTHLARRFDVLDLALISGHRDVNMLRRVYYRPTASQLADRMAQAD